MQQESKWKQDHRDWETTCTRIRSKREEEERRIRDARRRDILAEARKQRDDAVSRFDEEIAQAQAEKARKESELADMGFFQISEKMATRKRIAQICKEILPKLEKQKQEAIDLCRQETDQVEKVLSAQKEQIEREAASQHPMPTEPKKPDVVAQLEKERRPERIVEALKKYGRMRISDILEKVPEVSDLTPEQLSGILRTLYLNGRIDKAVEMRITYFWAINDNY